MKKTEILIGPTPDALVTYADPHRFKWLKLIDRDPVLLIPKQNGIHAKAGAGSVSFCLADNTYYKKYPGGMWTNDPDLAARAVAFTTLTTYYQDFDLYNSEPLMVYLRAPAGYTAQATGMSEDAYINNGWLTTRLSGLHVAGYNTVACIFPNGLGDVTSLKYTFASDLITVPDPAIFTNLSEIEFNISGIGSWDVVPLPSTLTKLAISPKRFPDGDDFSGVELPAGLLYLDVGGGTLESPGISADSFEHTKGGSLASCSLIQEFYMKGTFSSQLAPLTVDDFLDDLVATGSSGGLLDMSYQVPTSAGEASIVLLEADGWTVDR